MTPCIGLITVPNKETGDTIAKGLVSEKLAACVNVIPNITSFYWWDDAVQCDSELLLICKTTTQTWPSLQDWVKNAHPYSVAEIIQLPIDQGAPDYLQWITESIQK